MPARTDISETFRVPALYQLLKLLKLVAEVLRMESYSFWRLLGVLASHIILALIHDIVSILFVFRWIQLSRRKVDRGEALK